MKEIISKIENDLKVNEKCLQEETIKPIKKLLTLWIEYDKELLRMMKEIKDRVNND